MTLCFTRQQINVTKRYRRENNTNMCHRSSSQIGNWFSGSVKDFPESMLQNHMENSCARASTYRIQALHTYEYVEGW